MILFENARIFDGSGDVLTEGHVLVEGATIREVSDVTIRSDAMERIDLAGRTLMPGLTDAHVHVWASSPLLGQEASRPSSYWGAYSAHALAAALNRGFTTMRDAGGSDIGIVTAQQRGYLPGARLLHAGRFMSQTGGHGDMRDPTAHVACSCSLDGERLVALVDSPDEMRKAVREELRKGAHAIKLMGSGGVTSPADPLDRMQFSDEEIRVAVEECDRHGAYAMAHCHPDEAARRCVALGVRSIEHGSLIGPETAAFIAEQGAWVVPTLAIVSAFQQEGAAMGAALLRSKSSNGWRPGVQQALADCHAAGVKLGFGTDLIGPRQARQGSEFGLRREVLPAVDILRQATSGNAALFRMDDQIGRITEGFRADLIVVDGDPIADVTLLDRQGATLPVIMQMGRLHKRTL